MDITVLTAMPNYPQMKIYEGYEGKSYMMEDMQGIKVHRSSIYIPKNKSIVSRLRNYFSFVLSSAIVGKNKLEKRYDFLMCESPPLFLGYSAMFLAKRKKAKLIFNVSDLWPESAEKLGVVTNARLLSMAYRLEEKLYKRSALVTGQTQGICKNIQQRFPDVKAYWLPNGVDLSMYDPETIEKKGWRASHGFSQSDRVFLYAGIIGIAQGLEVILKAAQLTINDPHIKYVLLGSGPEKEKLLAMKHSKNLEHVVFLDGVSKAEMKYVLAEVDAAIIPLRKLDLFLGAIPSKIFENLAMKVPILLGVDGEARALFVEEGKCALYFEPENENALADLVKQLSANENLCRNLGAAGRSYANTRFNRDLIASSFYRILSELT